MRLFSAARSDAARIDAQGDSVRPNISEERERGGGVRPGEGAVAPNGHGPVSGPPEKQALQKSVPSGSRGGGSGGDCRLPRSSARFAAAAPGSSQMSTAFGMTLSNMGRSPSAPPPPPLGNMRNIGKPSPSRLIPRPRPSSVRLRACVRACVRATKLGARQVGETLCLPSSFVRPSVLPFLPHGDPRVLNQVL